MACILFGLNVIIDNIQGIAFGHDPFQIIK